MSDETFKQKFDEFENSVRKAFNPETAETFLEVACRDGSMIRSMIDGMQKDFAVARMRLLLPYMSSDELLADATRTALEDFNKYEHLAASWRELVNDAGSGTEVSRRLQELELITF